MLNLGMYFVKEQEIVHGFKMSLMDCLSAAGEFYCIYKTVETRQHVNQVL